MSDRDFLTDRVTASVDCLNRGDPDGMLVHYSDDVVVTTPLFRPGDEGEAVLVGKAAFRDYLINFINRYRSFRVLEVQGTSDGFVTNIELAGGVGEVAYSVAFGPDGQALRVVVFAIR